MWQGYSVGWWRARHNTHHLVTNEDGNDPDIKTAPLLVYVRNNPAIAATLNAVQRWQQYYYVPLMSILDAYWRFESLQVAPAPSPAAKRTPTLAPSLPLSPPTLPLAPTTLPLAPTTLPLAPTTLPLALTTLPSTWRHGRSRRRGPSGS